MTGTARFAQEARVRAGGSLIHYGARLAPCHVGPGPLAARSLLLMLALWGPIGVRQGPAALALTGDRATRFECLGVRDRA